MGFADRIRSFFASKPTLSPEFFDDLADLLVEGDFDAKEAFSAADLLRDRCGREKISDPEEARLRLAVLLEETLRAIPSPRSPLPDPGSAAPDSGTAAPPAVILMLGVNGVGKTTTAAKLASMFLAAGRRPVLAAADTFRAAAIDQLKIHGERLGVRVVAHRQGGDPAAVVYDAIEAAKADGAAAVIADTAGRMHTKTALVEELRKIDRIAGARGAGACVRYLVLDSTTGRNAVAQAEVFAEAVALDAVVLSKCDSTAKGGAVFSLASSLRLPVAFLCHGEGYGDIRPFDAAAFAREFVGAA